LYGDLETFDIASAQSALVTVFIDSIDNFFDVAAKVLRNTPIKVGERRRVNLDALGRRRDLGTFEGDDSFFHNGWNCSRRWW
jgi:hypothetical protein